MNILAGKEASPSFAWTFSFRLAEYLEVDHLKSVNLLLVELHYAPAANIACNNYCNVW